MAKRYLYKIYDSDGDYVGTLNDVVSEIKFKKEINGGLGELKFKLPRLTSDFDENDTIKFGNEVRVYCFDDDADEYEIHDLNQYDYKNEEWEFGDGDALNIATETSSSFIKKGSGAVKFDVDVSQDPLNRARIKLLRKSSLDLSAHYDTGSFYAWFYLPFSDFSDWSYCGFWWGRRNSAGNFEGWYDHAVTDAYGNAFREGWNLAKVDWNAANADNSPTIATAQDLKEFWLGVGYAAPQVDISGIRVDDFKFVGDSMKKGKLIYSGIISRYVPFLRGKKELIEVSCLGYFSDMARHILRDKTDATQIDYATTDPSEIIRDLIDKYRGKPLEDFEYEDEAELRTHFSENNDAEEVDFTAVTVYAGNSAAYFGWTGASGTRSWWGTRTSIDVSDIAGVGSGTPKAGKLCLAYKCVDYTAITNFLIDVGSGGSGLQYTITPASNNQWNYLEIDLEDFTVADPTIDYTDIDYLGIAVTGAGANGLYLDHICFIKSEAKVNWEHDSLELTGGSETYQFNANNCQEAIRKGLELCPENWFFRVGADNILKLGAKSEKADHEFKIGRHIINFVPEKLTETIINQVYFTGGLPEETIDLFEYANDAAIQAEWADVDDADNPTTDASDYKEGSYSGVFNWTNSGGTATMGKVGLSVDLSSITMVESGQPIAGKLKLWLKMTDNTAVTGIDVRIGSDGSNYATVSLDLIADNNWHEYELDMTTAAITGTPDWTSVAWLQVRIDETASSSLNIDQFQAVATKPVFKKYEDLTSIRLYGIHTLHKQDERVTNISTMDSIADAIIEAHKYPEIRTKLRVLGSTYDIESIEPGDTCQIRNFVDKLYSKWDISEWDVDYWDFSYLSVSETIMQIQSVLYTPNYAEIELSSKAPRISDTIEAINRNLRWRQTRDNPSSPIQ